MIFDADRDISFFAFFFFGFAAVFFGFVFLPVFWTGLFAGASGAYGTASGTGAGAAGSTAGCVCVSEAGASGVSSVCWTVSAFSASGFGSGSGEAITPEAVTFCGSGSRNDHSLCAFSFAGRGHEEGGTSYHSNGVVFRWSGREGACTQTGRCFVLLFEHCFHAHKNPVACNRAYSLFRCCILYSNRTGLTPSADVPYIDIKAPL